MNAPLLIRAVSILSFFCLAGGAPVSDASDSPHAVANGCLAHVCETPECRLTCDATCLLCHDEQVTPDLSGATAWNSTGAEIAEVYPQQMAAAASSLADSCRDCHQGHYDSGFHHPVDVRYPPTSTGVSEFIDNPDGVHLVCGSEGECQVSCVSCHNVHPTEQAAVEDTRLLQTTTEGSQLCLNCHAI